jgi:hypothetical protein
MAPNRTLFCLTSLAVLVATSVAQDRINITVRDAKGKPVSKAIASPQWIIDGTTILPTNPATTDAKGHLSIELELSASWPTGVLVYNADKSLASRLGIKKGDPLS